MKLILAYILSLICIPIISIISIILFSPIKKTDVELLYGFKIIVRSIVSNFVLIYISKSIFLRLVNSFSIVPILVFFAILSAHNIVRLLIFKRSEIFIQELSYTIGGTLGLFAGSLYFVYNVRFRIVSLIFIIPVLIFIYLFRLTKKDYFPFWKLVTENPVEAYNWFYNEPCWVIYNPERGYDFKPDKKEYIGPFMMKTPSLGAGIVLIYGHKKKFKDSQKRFIEKYRMK